MHTRLHTVVSRSRSNLLRRRSHLEPTIVRRKIADRWPKTTHLRSLSSDASLHRPRNKRRLPSSSSLYSSRSSTSFAPAATLHPPTVDDERKDPDLDEEIERFTNSCMEQMLPKEIFYQDGEFAATNIGNDVLYKELGLQSVWDAASVQDDDENDDDSEANALESDGRNSSPPVAPPDPTLGPTSTSGKSSQNRQARKRTVLEMLRNFDAQDPPTSEDPEEIQLWLECAAQREAVLRYQTVIDNARERKAYDSLSMTKRYVVQWYQEVRDAIELRQKEFLSNNDDRRGRKRYGPLLCSLHPEKMAVIVATEAITHALLQSGKDGREGVTLVKMALAIGSAVETEVVTQRRIKERFHDLPRREDDDSDQEEENITTDDISDNMELSEEAKSEENGGKLTAIERWTFSASHLKLYLEELNRVNPKLGKSKRAINYAMRRAKKAMEAEDRWSSDDLTHLGAALLSILVDHATVDLNGKMVPAFRVEKRWSQDTKSRSYVVLDDGLHKLFVDDEFLSFAAVTTRYTPMVVPPTEWRHANEGGYRWLKVDLMRTHGSNFQREALKNADLSVVCDGLNILGKQRWKINEEILEVAQYCWKNNVSIGDIPTKTDYEIPPVPSRPERIDAKVYADPENPLTQATISANREYRERMAKKRKTHQKNMDLRSLRCSAILKLNQAEKFKNFEQIYFPYNLDFRGRAYPVPPHLSNVGSDLCRGILTFADAKPLGKRGLYWLKVHLANFAGQDKVSFDERAAFVDDNMDKVRKAAEDPFTDKWWMSLEDPFQGLSTCHEIVRALDSGNPETYMCSLPVHMDGSCNGLQHYAALGRDTVGGKAVNLLEGKGPEDVYVGVMHEVIRRVAEEAGRDVDFGTTRKDELDRAQRIELRNNKAAKLVNGMIDRGVVKRTVMTSVYGVTYVGARQQIQEKIEEKLAEHGHDIDELEREIFAAAGYLATLTIDVMGDLFQGAKKTKSWLAECARLISQQGQPVAWISPIGVPAIQPYRQKRPRTVVTVMQSVTVADENDDLPVHRSRQCTAFPPNYVHSLDSSHMLLTAMEMDRRGLAFSAVHDSFWTHACDVDEMNEALRDCFVELYSQPLLSDLKQSWELRYPDIEFPELPELGDLDLDEVKTATYFFQ